jgi:catechol 2,3-dioxygenase-like lactoylglutathione lyase family enzyme
MKIDHVTIAGSNLSRLQAAFSGLGLATDYGGPHSNGVTHMALLGFDDGSYIELISTLEPGRRDTNFWGEHIAADGGPCAWAVYVEDVAAEVARAANLGVKVSGPHAMHRRRPDGQLVEWELAFLGDQGAGATLPFIIKDSTPRDVRVRPSASVAGRPGQPALLSGVHKVILGVKDLPTTAALFRRLYGWPEPRRQEMPQLGATLADFAGTPVTLAAPLASPSWLAERLARFDESPCAFLIGAANVEAARRRFALSEPLDWFGRRAAWFDPAPLNGTRLGIIG